MKIAFLGIGRMGAAIARHLMKSGQDLTVWNRTAAPAQALGAEGALVATTVAEAVRGADIVFTMVIDDRALEDILTSHAMFDSLPKDAMHVSLSTLSVAFSKKLTTEHAERGQHFVAAPVFGRPHIAEVGKLWVAVGGAKDPVERVRPLLEKFSRGITVVAEHPWSAHALKLGGNFLITAMIASLSEAFVYAESTGVEPGVFLDTVNKALFQSPFYEMYGNIMLTPPEKPGATMAVGEKDMRLFREAAQQGQVKTPLADLFMATLQSALEAGMKEADWAAGYLQLQRSALVDPPSESAGSTRR
ncbi:MAG TPA: NAD(P)-dependent oxidoreductase [Acidobacteriaceae bacterium]|jgi:3-hydroxyisobutyrate dehydrogenase-like beta-hydroxyacid dehydrogenase|nr:NAD(P)-dependent oxidoreductase [Acidobacteriaceae bacterium]